MANNPFQRTCTTFLHPFSGVLKSPAEPAGTSARGRERYGMEPQTPRPVLLTVEEAATYLRIGRTAMYGLIRDGRVRCVRVLQDTPRIRISDLDRLIEDAQDGE